MAPPTPTSTSLAKVEYWHLDHLGSLASTTDHTGAVTARYSYDPFGKRRTPDGQYDAAGAVIGDWNPAVNFGTDRGYTGHEHLDDIGVIHMNGRLFDPTIARMLQPDRVIQAPENLQDFNRYTYCFNNPSTCTDPSGLERNSVAKADAEDETDREVTSNSVAIQRQAKNPGGEDKRTGPDTPEITVADLVPVYGPVKGFKESLNVGMDAQLNGKTDVAAAMYGIALADAAMAIIDGLALGGATVAKLGFKLLAEGAANASRKLATDSAAEMALGVEDKTAVRDVVLPSAHYPETAAHVRDAQAQGHPEVLTIDRAGASSNRAAAQACKTRVPGKQLDEYPPAMFREGGAGASIRPVTPRDNLGAGACIGNQCRGLPDGTRVRIRVE